MKSTLLASVLVSAICFFPASPIARAQGVGTSGEITGTIIDPAGAAIPNAKVTVSDVEKGVQRTVLADSGGLYRVTGLPPSRYRVSAEFSGFQTEVQTNVELTVGQVIPLDFHLKIAKAEALVEVTSQAPVVETERSQQSNTVEQQYIEALPINRRDYLTFTLLLPGVSDSSRLADDQDFRVKQTPQSGLSFYGSNGRGNSVTVDGGEANNDSGSVRLTLSQDAVQEFQINRSNYGAELGGASGATINIVSKSGTNVVHGSLFGFFRNDAMDARDPFAFNSALAADPTFSNFNFTSAGAPVKNSLSRYQYGGTIGFPIKKDKTFLFAAFEGLLQNAQNAVPLLTNSSIFAGPNFLAAANPFPSSDVRSAQQSIVTALVTDPGNPVVPCLNKPLPNGTITIISLPAQICAGALTTALTVSPVTGLPGTVQNATNQFLINQFETNGGLFNYNTREYLASGRLDHRFDDSNQLYISYRYGYDREENPDVQSLTGFSAGSSIHYYDDNIQAGWFHQFSANTQNEFRAQWNYDSFNVIPNKPAEPGLQIFGFANNLGTSIFLPSFTITRRTEIADNFTMTRGHHTMKFGGSELLRGDHAESHTFFPGRFVFGPLPGVVLSPCLANPNGAATANPNTAGCGLPGTLSRAALDSLQGASLGAPQFYQQGFGTADYPAYTRPYTSLYWQDSWRMAENFTLNYGVRYEIDSEYLPLNTYYGDVGPRVSFAWDPFKDHKTVIRGGYGIFYGPIDAQIPQVDLSLGVLNKNRSTVENQNNTSQVPDQVKNLTQTCGINIGPVPIIPGTGASPCNRYIAIYADSLTGISALGVQGAAAVFQTLFAQGKIQCTTPTPGNSACITPADLMQFGIFVANSGPVSPATVVFSNPTNYKPPYSQQASFGIEREIAPGFSVSVSGIYSHTLRLPVAIDTNLLPAPMSTVTLANGKTVSYRNWNLSPGPDPLFGTEPGGLPCAANPTACFVNPLIAQNNQYTSAASGLYEGGILEIKKRFSNSFMLLGNYTFSKGYDTSTDFNSDYGPQDPTNLGFDRALSEFDERHKIVIAGVFDSPWKGPILSGFELAPIFTYHSGLPFNLLAGGEVNGNNHTTNERPIGAPRDTGLGPDFYNFDMRLSWQHKLTEKAKVQFTAEGFNIANRTNYASVNNEVSPLFGFAPNFTTFSVHGSKLLSPSQPLGFTSAFPKRQIQLGVRLEF
jgi:hypothetical protein